MVRFPVAVFLRFFFAQLIIFNVLFIAAVSLLSSTTMLTARDFWPALGFFFLLSAVASALTSWRFTLPIRRTLQRALLIASKKYAQVTGETDEKDLFREEPGEYSQLASALERIDRKLKKRKERLQREREEYAAFMGSVQEGLLSVDSEGWLRDFNSQFAALFVPPEALQSQEGIRLTDVIRAPQIFEAFRRVLDTNITEKMQVRLSTRVNSQPRDFAVSLAPLRKEGSVRGVIGIFHDITDIKQAERVRIEFVANASHELRTPLTSVKGYLDTLKEDFAANRLDQAGNFLGIVSNNVDRLIDLVNDLLALSALEHNPELKLENVNALAISDHVIRELSGLAAAKHQVIRVSGDVPAFLADAGKIEQVLRNLVSNAIKYMPEGKQVRIVWETGAQGVAILRVIDDGPGIAPEHHARLFERFYRIDRGRSRDAGGTGLGLAIVKHIMQSHGGSVEVRSQVGQGAEFICTFPRSRETVLASR